MIRALPWMASVIMPAWLPVKDWAEAPVAWIAMARRAMEMRSPALRSMSISRASDDVGLTCVARSSSSSVLSPIAETTTTTWWPADWVSTTRCATRLIPSASATDDPPNFWTMRLMHSLTEEGRRRREPAVLAVTGGSIGA